ncbi:hypothetical protein IW140_000421 [Coemansia sp. RSA 1813]|nr:hypothetical protein LPJ74_000803 [Coemansia sp. RSA 1843]KAJ2217741.1 hypothetical protein EV179_000226 [Coemansia sp. RSA 487]KAJ2573022.1 hypothetical protein IW140_000421 [Coemansia sp. RSA 1813]
MSTPPTSNNNNNSDNSSTVRQHTDMHHDVSTFLDNSFLSQLALPHQIQPEHIDQPLQYPQEWLEAASSSMAMGDNGADTQNETAGAAYTGSAYTPREPVAAAPSSRVSRACASCRGKKIRCEGGQPKCKNCLLRRIDCFYPEQKKRGRPPKSQMGQQGGEGQKQKPVTARRDSPGKVSSAENSGSEIQKLWPKESDSTHVNSEGCSMPLFPTGELASDGSFKHGSFPQSFSFDAVCRADTSNNSNTGNISSHVRSTRTVSVDQSPVAVSRPPSSSITSSHAFPLGYGSFSFGQQADVVSPMDTSSPGVVGGAGALSSGRANASGSLGQQLYSTSHSASSYATPLTGNIQQGFYNYSPPQSQQQQQQQQQNRQQQQAPQDDYFGRVLASSSHNTPIFHTSSAEKLQGTVPLVPPNIRSFDSSNMPDAHRTSLSHIYYDNSASGFGDLKITASRTDSDSNPRLFSTTWGEASPASLTRPQSNIYNSLPFDFSNIVSDIIPFTIPPPVPYVLQQQTQEPAPHPQPISSILYQRKRDGTEQDLLSSTLGNVAMAIAKRDANSDNLQKTMDHLLYVTTNISNASQQAFENAKEVAAEALATTDSSMQTDSWSFDNDIITAPISESLLRIERRPDLSSKSVHNYFSYIHHQCPIIHKPTFLRQMDDGTVNRFVWFSLRALTARTLLHSHTLSKDDVLVEEAYFAAMARKQLATELDKPNMDVLQGLVLFTLYILGTPRWEEASMYWCKAMRLAQLMGCHVVDAPSQAVATKMHFGIFEPPSSRPVSHDNLGVIPGDLSGLHLPLTRVLTPLETELRRRLWWILFTNERFGAVAERLPTMVDESRIFVHLPCSAEEWEKPVFSYKAPERVPKYRRGGYTHGNNTKASHQMTLVQEIAARKDDNLYMISDIEYGFAMGHLVTFLANMGSLFWPLSPYSNDYVQPFAGVDWQRKINILQTNVERIEALFEASRRDTLQRLNARPQQGGENSASTFDVPMHSDPEALRFKKRRDSSGGDGGDSKAKQHAFDGQYPARSSSIFRPAARRSQNSVDPVLDEKACVSGIEIPHLHHLNMLILYSTLNIQLYRMVFQIHYEFSSSLPVSEERQKDDRDLLAAFDKYVKSLWQRATTAAQQVSRILRGEFPNVPHWVLTLAGIKAVDAVPSTASQSSTPAVGSNQQQQQQDTSSLGTMDVDSEAASPQGQEGKAATQNSMSHRLKRIFRERIKSQEKRLHEMATSVFTSYRRTMPYALLLAAKVHVDNIKWWTNEKEDVEMARAYLDLAVIVQFLETHQTSFSSTDYVFLVKSMMQVVDIS